MMTGILALEYGNMSDNVTATYEALKDITLEDSHMGILIGEELTMEQLVTGMLVYSANDAANVIAIHLAGSIEAFVEMMNNKAQELGMKNTHFVNACGTHDDNHYTTAYDMSLIAKACMEYDIIAEAAKETSFSGNGAGKQKYNVEGKTSEYTWYSHNELLTGGANYYEYATGIKTGFTDQAGDCLAASATKDNENLIAIIMNSEDPGRWEDAQNLFNWAFDSYDMTEYRQAGAAATARLSGHNRLKGDTAEIMIENSMSEYLTAEEAANVETKIIYDAGGEFLEAPVNQGDKIGKLQFILDGEVIGEADAFAAVDVKKANVFNTALYYLKVFFEKVTARENLKYTALAFIVVIFIVLILILRHKRKQRYKIKGRYYSQRGTYDTSRINNGKRRRKNNRRDKYNRYK